MTPLYDVFVVSPMVSEELTVDDVRVLEVGCLTDGHEALIKDDVEVVSVDCCTDGVEVLLFDDVADR